MSEGYVVILDDRAFGPLSFNWAVAALERARAVDSAAFLAPLHPGDEFNDYVAVLEEAPGDR